MCPCGLQLSSRLEVWGRMWRSISRREVERWRFLLRAHCAWQDALLAEVARKHGNNWKEVCRYFKDRTDAQCMLRHQKLVAPTVIKGPWTKEVRTGRLRRHNLLVRVCVVSVPLCLQPSA